MPRLSVIESSNPEWPDPHARLTFSALQDALTAHIESPAETGAVDAVDLALAQAALHRASDLYFEPWADCLALRYRIDGILHDAAVLPKAYQSRIMARLKILARIVTYQRDMPQDGRIEPEATPCGKAMRVSTFPTVNGERVLVRILDSPDSPMTLGELGFDALLTAALRDLITRPQGTLLLTGPSSSGKTTTIYALLREILDRRRPAPHVVTIEDPVEYRLDRIAQTEVNPHAGLTFEAALRAVLRQDPEVIMLGEIRDSATAHAAVQAGLTGHLVISTIHSGTAAGVFTRLIDMGVEPFLVASSVTGVLAQRLVRTVCPHCAVDAVPDDRLRTQYGLAGVDGCFRQGQGCECCEGIGYRGRTAIGELMPVDETIAELILGRTRTVTIHEAALSGGMKPLARDGAERVRTGATTLEELFRVLPAPGARAEAE
ncbi:MAG: type II/IV secretion system protein [Candidatus Hydrogenedentes bacterium]|nr:type II/IV secretion system protein [Candidatus Hydrogenedentota bacterium]